MLFYYDLLDSTIIGVMSSLLGVNCTLSASIVIVHSTVTFNWVNDSNLLNWAVVLLRQILPIHFSWLPQRLTYTPVEGNKPRVPRS